jgi:hypothetical protein
MAVGSHISALHVSRSSGCRYAGGNMITAHSAKDSGATAVSVSTSRLQDPRPLHINQATTEKDPG